MTAAATVSPKTRFSLLAGAAALALAGAASAQPAHPEGPEAAIVEGVDQDAPSDAAVTNLLEDARAEAPQNSALILPAETDEAEITADAIAYGDDEAEGVHQLRIFLAMDADQDLIVSEDEWMASSAAATPYVEADVNASGKVGFAEYRLWRSLQEAGVANDNANGMGGPLETPSEPAGVPRPLHP